MISRSGRRQCDNAVVASAELLALASRDARNWSNGRILLGKQLETEIADRGHQSCPQRHARAASRAAAWLFQLLAGAALDRVLVAALGIDAEGHKHLLSLVEGATALDPTVCRLSSR